MQFSDDIQALRRGELDHATILGRIRAYLGRSEANASELKQALEQARQADHITQADYDLLTQCIVDVSERPGDDGTSFVAPGSSDFDDSMTRLATSLSSGESDQSTVDVGSRLRDRFILDEVVGAGGMGTVYRGRDVLKIEAQDRNPYVAIKILNDSFKERPDAFIVLQREASRQQRLAHPNIATVYDFDRSGGIMFITMEYLDGVSLDHFIKHEVRDREGLPLDEALPIIEGMCAALSHAHARGIVHADFKPGNCFITEGKQLKVLDFGIARAMKDPARLGEETVFDPRSIGALTPAYASPEMLENSDDADPRDDIYALACVSYELLSGRHPFHRIPADKAKANKLKPERIRHLTRRQNDALARALAFERAERTRTVNEFLEGLGRPVSAVGGLRLALVVGAAGLLVAAALVVPGLMERWEGDALLERMSGGEVAPALAELDALSREQQLRVLQEGRLAILEYLRSGFDALMAEPDEQVDFAAAEQLLASGTALYADSAALRELSDQFSQRREAYLSGMIKQFERYLEPEYLLPVADAPDLHDLLARLAEVDPTNPLLADSRVPGAYADSVESALVQDEVAGARRFLDAGLELAPEDATLADLRDRVVAAEQRLAREAEIERLEGVLAQAVSGAESMDDVVALVPIVTDLRNLVPEDPGLEAAGRTLAERFAGDRDAASTASTLPEVEAYLAAASGVWDALGQAQMIEPVEARRAALIDGQADLVRQARQAMRQDDMRGDDGRSAAELIADVRAIDPADPRPAILLSELVQVRRGRAEQYLEQGEWQAARDELAAAAGLGLSADQRNSLAADRDRLDAAEQRADERAAAAAQLAQAQQQAELERQAREREEELAAQRAARVAAAARALDESLAGFDPARLVQSMRAVLDRSNELQALDAAHPALADAGPRLEQAVEAAIRGRGDTGQALALAGTAEDVLGSRPWLTQLQDSLQARLDAEQGAARRAAIAAAEARLDRALATAALAEDTGRSAAQQALAELADLLADDPAELAAARERFVAAYLSSAQGLLDDKRFTVAESVIEAAAEVATTSQQPRLDAARDSLVAARDAYRQERARQETQARIEALAQRFALEVSSGQLTRARGTLGEYRDLAPDTALARGEGAERLADGYQRIGRQRLDAGNVDGAGELVALGLEIVPGHPGLEALGNDVERAALRADIAGWFAGQGSLSVAQVRGLTQRYRELDPDDYGEREAAWAASAAGYLSTLREDPETHNRFLQDARSVLADDGPLVGLTTILPALPEPDVEVTAAGTQTPSQQATPRVSEQRPAAAPHVVDVPVERQPAATIAPPVEAPAMPELASADLLGRWCTEDLEIEFEQDRMVFTLNGGRANYPVSAYDVSGDSILVNWSDRQLGPMIFEFGRFTDDRGKMVQIRGRPADDETWRTYNRDFLRCG